MLRKGIAMCREAGVPISGSICPTVKINRRHSSFGRCVGPESANRHPDYDYVIEFSRFALGNSEKSVMNTILHELIHTCEDTHGHDLQWKAYTKTVSDKYGYNICRCGGDKTDEDLENIRKGLKPKKRIYAVKCPECDTVWRRKVLSRLITQAENYRCPRCGCHLTRID